mmetsp:Transcript_8929/g.13407  ORF Transcript_8929/g.13407 Transcript_8929/m.13407 type:complete len:174 (+) Transcript_8929:3-524(+)
MSEGVAKDSQSEHTVVPRADPVGDAVVAERIEVLSDEEQQACVVDERQGSLPGALCTVWNSLGYAILATVFVTVFVFLVVGHYVCHCVHVGVMFVGKGLWNLGTDSNKQTAMGMVCALLFFIFSLPFMAVGYLIYTLSFLFLNTLVILPVYGAKFKERAANYNVYDPALDDYA